MNEARATEGDAAQARGDFVRAEALARAQSVDQPQDGMAHVRLGLALAGQARLPEALAAFETALRLDPRLTPVERNIGLCHLKLNALDQAQAAFERYVRAVDQKDVDAKDEGTYGVAHWDLAQIDLLRGDWPRGFARFRARFGAVPGMARPNLPRPLWQGEPLAGKTLLLYDEQGLGDTLMLLRYLPLLERAGARVRAVVQAPLVPLVRGDFNLLSISPRDSAVPVDFDFTASFFDLPLRFGTTPDAVPFPAGYLPARPAARRRAPRVAVVWSGARGHINDAARSLPLALFARLFRQSNVAFHSFAKTPSADELQLLQTANVINRAPDLVDFAATAEALADIDLIIACDTALAHLAGAMGKDVWILLPFAPDWRWGLEGTTTPWYKTARLFRQATAGDWDDVIARVADALAQRYKALEEGTT
jgi:tetratricopeptide (TPR) repeat protein